MIALKFSSELSLPLDAVTQTFAILAKRRVGKTYTASVIAEEMVVARLPFVVLDPTGAWWGLRSSADGKHDGLPVIIIGGAHGDVPLEATAGKVIADLVVEHPGFYVIDLSATASNAEQDRFATDFAERLYRRKEAQRSPLHVFIDEADAFAPQRPLPGQQRMLGAFEALVRRGGIRGIGVTLITQRPAVVNKNVLTQTECLIVLQMTAPQDQKAIDDWVQLNGTREQRDVMMASLASLKKGEAWVWSPAWLEVFQRVHVRERDTFNSSATPKAGERAIEPTRLAAVDLDKLKDKIASTIEKAKADDPHELKRQIAELKKQVGKQIAPPAEVKMVEVPAIDKAEMDRLAGLIRELREFGANASAAADKIAAQMQRVNQGRAMQIATAQVRSVGRRTEAPQPRVREHHKPRVVSERMPLAKAEKSILAVLAQYPEGRSATQVALLAGYAVNGGGFNNAIGALRSNEFIRGGKEHLRITDEGLSALGDYDPLPSGQALIDYWLGRLPKAERAIFKVLTENYPAAMSKDEVAEMAGYEASGGGFNNALGKLRTLELIGGRGELKASDTLFE